MKKATTLLIAALAVTLAGCAPSSKDLGSTYVSPLRYKDFSCADLHAESNHILEEIGVLGGSIDKSSAETNQLTGAGIILSPFTFGLSGMAVYAKTKDIHKDASNISAFSQMKGNYDAVREAAARADCDPIPELTIAPAEGGQ